MAQQKSSVITVLFDTKAKKFLGRKGVWQTPDEFSRNPPEQGKDVARDDKDEGSGKTDPGGYFLCIDGTLYFFNYNPSTGGYERYNCGPCPW